MLKLPDESTENRRVQIREWNVRTKQQSEEEKRAKRVFKIQPNMLLGTHMRGGKGILI